MKYAIRSEFRKLMTTRTVWGLLAGRRGLDRAGCVGNAARPEHYLELVALRKECNSKRKDRWEDKCGYRWKVGRVNGGSARAHTRNHQS